MDELFKPKSVAVIGASERELTIGNRIIKNLLDMKFCGKIYPINPKSEKIYDFISYHRLHDIPYDIDLAHIVIKNSLVPQALLECAEKGIKVAIINTAGFKETGDAGKKLEDEIKNIATKTGIRVFGPNCQGIINTDNNVNAYCNFTFSRPKSGHISIFAQSGGIGEAILNRLCELEEGVRMYASSGNSCDITCLEILEYWGNDDNTKVIICHFENIKDFLQFEHIARNVSKKKPILGIFAGQTNPGAKAAVMHIGDGIGDKKMPDMIEKETGILLFDSIEEICQAARAFVHLPLPKGPNVCIITNTGGAGVIATDVLIKSGCRLPEPDEAVKAILKKKLYPEAILSNPIDILATATPDHFKIVLSQILSLPYIDSVQLNFVTPFFVNCEAVADNIVSIVKKADKPVVCVVMTNKKIWESTLNVFRQAGIPVYDYPEAGAKVVSAFSRYKACYEGMV